MDIIETASMLHVSTKTVRRLIKKGKINAKLIRYKNTRKLEIDKASIEQYLKEKSGCPSEITERNICPSEKQLYQQEVYKKLIEQRFLGKKLYHP